MNLFGACFDAWLGWGMFIRGFFWAAVFIIVLALVGFGAGVGLWRRRRYGFYLLNLSILCGIAGNIYGWVQPSEFRPLYRIAGNLGFFVAMAVIFVYFNKRRGEFS